MRLPPKMEGPTHAWPTHGAVKAAGTPSGRDQPPGRGGRADFFSNSLPQPTSKVVCRISQQGIPGSFSSTLISKVRWCSCTKPARATPLLSLPAQTLRSPALWLPHSFTNVCCPGTSSAFATRRANSTTCAISLLKHAGMQVKLNHFTPHVPAAISLEVAPTIHHASAAQYQEAVMVRFQRYRRLRLENLHEKLSNEQFLLERADATVL